MDGLLWRRLDTICRYGMVKNKIYFAPNALKDLEEIREYYIVELEAPTQGNDKLSKILANIDNLETFPQMGIELSTKVSVPNNYRVLTIEAYLVFYRIEKFNVYIDRIINGKREYVRILFDDKKEEVTK